MDAPKYKRRSIQKGRQTSKINLETTQPVIEGMLSRGVESSTQSVINTPSLPKLDATTADRFRTQRPVKPRNPHLRSPQPPRRTMVSDMVVTPAPQHTRPPVAQKLAPTSIAQTVTRLAVTPPPISAAITPNIDSIQPIAAATSMPEAVIQKPITPIAPAPQPTAPRQRLPGMDMELPGDASPDRSAESAFGRTKLVKARRFAFKGLAVAMAIFIVGGGLLFSQGYLKMHKVFRGGTGTAEALKEKVDPNLLKGEGSGRINVLLLGRGGGNHDAPDLTDTIMLASIDPVNHKTTLFSIPRDLYINIPSAGNMKINAAYQTGVYNYLGKRTNNVTDKKAVAAGFKMVDQAVEDVMGVGVDYNVMVDFAAFSQAVDTVSGLNVNVPSDLVDPTMAWENNNNPVLAKAGPQTFDGKHALIYVRSRETSSDFARAQRQRAMLMALKAKVDTLGTLSNPLKISGLMNAFGNNVQTDLSLKNASRLYGITKKISDMNTNSIGFADPPNQYVTTGNVTGQSIVLPKPGLFKYSEIQAFVRSQLKDPFILKENAKIVVLNGTTVPGVATAKADELRAYGYNVIKTGETPTNGWTQTMLVNLSKKKKNKYTAHYLENRLGITQIKNLPDDGIETNGADFVIIIGSDKATP